MKSRKRLGFSTFWSMKPWWKCTYVPAGEHTAAPPQCYPVVAPSRQNLSAGWLQGHAYRQPRPSLTFACTCTCACNYRLTRLDSGQWLHHPSPSQHKNQLCLSFFLTIPPIQESKALVEAALASSNSVRLLGRASPAQRRVCHTSRPQIFCLLHQSHLTYGYQSINFSVVRCARGSHPPRLCIAARCQI